MSAPGRFAPRPEVALARFFMGTETRQGLSLTAAPASSSPRQNRHGGR